MSRKIAKNILKQYFRSGSRPTQQQFYELIDNCYNEETNYSAFVSGYEVLMDIEKNKTTAVLKREAGWTIFVPFFDRINKPHSRVYHYSIPTSNLGQGIVLDRVSLALKLPENTQYSVRDGSKEVRISQTITIEYIKIYNGTEEIYTSKPDRASIDLPHEMQIGKEAQQWKGVSIDIAIKYDIRSDIAVSDQLDIASEKEQVLEHAFGSVGCMFIQNE